MFARQLGLNYQLLSDYNWEAARAFGVLREELFGFRPLNTRAQFLVDREGVLRYAWVAEDPSVLPDPEDSLASAKALRSRST